MRLEGRRVLITGASSGIGLALAHECARRGAILALASRRQEVLSAAARGLQTAYAQMREPLAIACDVADRSRVHDLVEQSVAVLGGIDILINNAGISVYGDTTRTLHEDFSNVLDVNFFGALNCIFEVLPHMQKAHSGLIVNVASMAAIHGVPYLAAYSASKAALVTLSQSLRAELAGSGVAVLNVYPDYAKTDLFDHEKKVGGARRPYRHYAPVTGIARQIVSAIEHDRVEVALSLRGKALFMFRGLVLRYVEKEMKYIAERLRIHQEEGHA